MIRRFWSWATEPVDAHEFAWLMPVTVAVMFALVGAALLLTAVLVAA